MTARQIDWARLERYVRREGTFEEMASDERWVHADPELAALAGAMRSIGRPPGERTHDWDEAAIWGRIRRRMPWYAQAARLAHASSAAPRQAAFAAAAALLLIAGAVAVRSSDDPPGAAHGVAATAPPREIATRRGQRAVLELNDGTRVTLGPESRLRIPASFGSPGTAREVELAGEGYFVVHHDTTRPFRVRTRAGTAEDVGTAFVITAHPETRGMQVLVTEGEVALRRAGSPPTAPPLVELTRGSLARLDPAGIATVTTVEDPSSLIAWTRGEIRFDGTPLQDALPALSRWYGLDLRLAQPALGSRRITASFIDRSPDQVLATLSLLLRLRLDRRGESITLHAR
jgi:transmembrane sensor